MPLHDIAGLCDRAAEGADRGKAAGMPSVARLSLSTFRCHHGLRLETEPAPVVLTGRNGAGKTSILEALSLLSPGRGLRRARMDELAWRPTDGEAAAAWAVAARLCTADGPIDVGTGCAEGGAGHERREVRINGERARSQAALSAVTSVLWLTPDMDRLFMDGAGARRRFLDRLVFGTDPAHAGRLSAYERAMQERSRLLRAGTREASWLAALEKTMAGHGVAIAAARRETAERLTGAGAEARPFPAASVAVAGTVEGWLDEQPALAVEDRLRAALAAARRSDAETGGAGVGPHRAEVVVTHAASGRPARTCSTGEQKALLIALVLASARLQRSERSAAPLLLLDEVAAHLDPWHRQALFECVEAVGGQAWYAGTDAGVFAPLAGRAQFFTVGAAAPARAAAAAAAV